MYTVNGREACSGLTKHGEIVDKSRNETMRSKTGAKDIIEKVRCMRG